MTAQRLVVGYALLSAAVAATLAVGLVVGPYRAIQRSDYMTYHVAGRIVLDGDGSCLYVPACQAAAQQELIGDEPSFSGGALPFNSPPIMAVVGALFGWLPLSAGFVIFVLLGLAALAVAAWKLAWGGPSTRLLAVLLVLGAWPTAMAAVRGQVSLLVIGAMGLSVAGQGYPRGLGLAIADLKPTLAPLWALWLAASGHWRPIITAAGAVLLLTAVTFVVVSPQAVADYPAYVLGVAGPNSVGVHPEEMVNWRGAGVRLGLGTWFLALGTIGTLGAVALSWWRTPRWRLAAASAFIATPLVIPHANQHEAILAIVGVLIAITAVPKLRVPLVTGALVLHAMLWVGPLLDGQASGAMLFAAELVALAVVVALSLERQPTP